MRALRFLLSPSGRLRSQAFVVAAVVVYVAGAASQLLTMPDVIARNGLWPFALAQAVLTWIWFAVHAKRLRDADRSIGLAVGASLLYALSVVLLLIVATTFFSTSGVNADASASGALGLIMLLLIIETLAGSSSYDFGWLMVALLTVLALLPIIVAVAVTLWAATRPSAAGQKP